MLEGITILSQSHAGFNGLGILFIIIFGLGLGVFMYTFGFRDKFNETNGAILMLFGAIFMAFGFIGGMIELGKTQNIIEYKVIISDDVNLKDFNERYEIIDQEGEIYTICEKEK